MSKNASAEYSSWKYDPKSPDLGCIRKGALDETDVEILRQLDKAKLGSLAATALLTPSAELLTGITKDKPVTLIKPVEKHPQQAPFDQPTDCGWGLPVPSKEEYLRAERENIAATLTKYFSKIDKGCWFGLGKDGEISKEELTEFLVSDKTEELTDHEMADLVKVFRNFDKIKDSQRDAGCLVTMGITRGDLRSYGHGGEVVYKRPANDLIDWSSSASGLLEALNKK